jgi:hypothetical protein
MVGLKKQNRPKKATAPRPTRAPLGALLFAALVLVVSCLYSTPFYPDDTYISFRYAENLVNGHGLAFNPGEPLEAYSNFLWIMVCAVLYKLGLTLTSVTPYVGVLLALGGLVFLWLLSRRRAKHPAQLFLPLLVYATAGPFVLYVVTGMESALFGFLLLALVYCADRVYERGTTGAWIGLTATGLLIALTRPEGIVVLPAALAYMAFDSRGTGTAKATTRFAIVSIAAFALLYGAYTVWRVGYFGEWLPTPFMSKGYETFPILTAWKMNFTFYFVSGSYFEAPAGYLFIALALVSIAGLVSSRDRGAAFRGDRLALVIAALMSAIYINFVDWMPAMRYQAPLVGLLCIPLVRTQRMFVGAPWAHGLSSAGLRAALALVIVMGAFGLHRLKIATRVVVQSHAECLIPMATWLKEALPANSLIAISDVGAVPYYSGLRTLDIHPASLTDIHIARDGLTTDYVLGRQPHAVVFSVRGIYTAKMAPELFELFLHERFNQEYRFVGTVRHRWYLDRSYWVYTRKNLELRPDVLAHFPTGMGRQHRLGSDINKPEPGR